MKFKNLIEKYRIFLHGNEGSLFLKTVDQRVYALLSLIRYENKDELSHKLTGQTFW